MRRLIAALALVFGMSLGVPSVLAHSGNNSPFIAGGGYLGVALSDIDADRASVLKLPEDRGAEVMLVEQAGPADKAGIQAGDVLLTYNGEKILGVKQLGRLVRETPPGRKVAVEYWRNGKRGKLSLVIGSLDDRSSGVPPEFARMQDMGTFNRLGFDVPNPVLLWRSSLLGVECEAVDSQLAEYFGVQRGVLVRFVLADSPAQKAGFKAGDVLTAVDGHPVATPRDVTASLRLDRHALGRHDAATIPVEITRNRKHLTLRVTPPPHSN